MRLPAVGTHKGIPLQQNSGSHSERNIDQSARYAQQLQLSTITVIFFVEAVDDENRARYEAPYHDADKGVTVEPVLVTAVE